MELADFLVKYWPLIVGGLAILAVWFDARGTDKDHEKRITHIEDVQLKELNTRIDKFDPVLLQIQKEIVAINTKLDIYFKDK